MTERIRLFAILLLVGSVASAGNAIAESSLMESPSESKLPLKGSEVKPPPQIQLPAIQRPIPDSLSTKELLHFTPRDFRFKGNSVFGDDELRQQIRQFINTPINSIDLEEIRLIITNYYINHGYITSGAIIPDQDLQDGLLLIEIKEGTLSDIEIHNHGRLNPRFIKKRLKFDGLPVQLTQLQEKLYKLQREPSIKHITAKLIPGDIRGRSTLDLDVTENKAYSLDLEFNNHRPVSIGERQTIFRFKHINLSGWGDSLNAEFHRTSGMIASQLAYDLPVNASDDSIYFSVNHSSTELSEADQAFTQFFNEFNSVATGYRQSVIESKSENYDIDWRLEHKRSYNSVALQECDLAPLDTLNLSVFRLGQSFVYHPQDLYFSFRHTMSVGVNVFDSLSCSGPKEADRHFSAWLWQFLWPRRCRPAIAPGGR